MERRDKQIIKKILSEIEIAEDMIQGKDLEEFKKDEILKRAICMTVINIGELVKNVTEETRKTNDKIPWRAIAGFRDIAAHKYQTLRMDDVYQTVTEDFGSLRSELENMLSATE